MSHSSAIYGYETSYCPRSLAPFNDPVERRRGYTQPHLSKTQHGAVMVTAAFTAALLGRPIDNLQKLYFISDVPGGMPRAVQSHGSVARTVLKTRWFSGIPLWRSGAEFIITMSVFVHLRDAMDAQKSLAGGVAAGAITGGLYTLMRHPYDVLRATAEAPPPARAFSGPWSVLRTAAKERPSMLLSNLYRGVSAVALGRCAQFGAQLGMYNYLRYDGVYRGTGVLFLYCHASVLLGMLLQYPLLSMRQQLQAVNAQVKGRPLTYRALMMDHRRRHGITKLYDGFFSSKPILRAVTPALFMVLYDVLSRRYTERLHPERRAGATPTQPLTAATPRLPDYATRAPRYEYTEPTVHYRRL